MVCALDSGGQVEFHVENQMVGMIHARLHYLSIYIYISWTGKALINYVFMLHIHEFTGLRFVQQRW